MTVLCEAMSVVIRCDSIEAYYEGGWRRFLADVPNGQFCTDNELARVGFMVGEHVIQYLEILHVKGLQFCPPPAWWHLWNSNPLPFDRNLVRKVDDIVVVDQHKGPTSPCDWVQRESIQLGIDGPIISGCSLLVEGRENAINLSVPEGWTIEQAKGMNYYGDERQEDKTGGIEFLKTQGKLDVYREIESGKQVFRPSADSLLPDED